MDGKVWQTNQKPYNRNIVEGKIKGFHKNSFADPNEKNKWTQFAKSFSEMKINDTDVEEMSFETFIALKEIMSGALSSLSDSTNHQRKVLEDLQGQHQKLIEEEKKLNKIHEDNIEKEENVNKVLERLRREKQKLNDESLGTSSLLQDVSEIQDQK